MILRLSFLFLFLTLPDCGCGDKSQAESDAATDTAADTNDADAVDTDAQDAGDGGDHLEDTTLDATGDGADDPIADAPSDSFDADTSPEATCWPDPVAAPIFEPNPTARADAFKLFYKERSQRVLRSVNRFALAGDVTAANFFGRVAVARSGNAYEVVPGPNDNMPMGKSLFATWKLYQALGGRDFELSLIRMLEGAVFNESVSGHPGLTTREALPGWTLITDGVTDTITRTRFGAAIDPPATPDPGLEQEILDTFYDGVTFTYRENPEEYFFSFMPVHDTGPFAITYVFDELDHAPPFLRQSDCCSSFMISQRGPWAGAYWGNHNSRDNFTDIAIGFIAAMEMSWMDCLPPDVQDAALRAVEAARRTGDNIMANGSRLMTVDEWHDYDTLTVAGWKNPDGEEESQDLGSLNSCAMIYLAHAISSSGLSSPVPATPLPGTFGPPGLMALLPLLGLSTDGSPDTCNSIDEAFGGVMWDQLARPGFWNLMRTIAPDTLFSLIDSTLDDFADMLIGPVALAYYARMNGDTALYNEAIANMTNMLRVQEIMATIVRDDGNPARIARLGQMEYMGGIYARMLLLDSSLSFISGFGRGEGHTSYLENQLAMADTSTLPLMSDAEIEAKVETGLAAITERAPWRVDRYRDRFGYDPPVRRSGDGYEAVQSDDSWGPVENPRHVVLGLGGIDLWFEAGLCMESPLTLDCSWARLGCGHVDLDAGGSVDGADIALFDSLWGTWGADAICTDENDHCDHADLDLSGVLNSDDRAYIEAAQGCVP